MNERRAWKNVERWSNGMFLLILNLLPFHLCAFVLFIFFFFHFALTMRSVNTVKYMDGVSLHMEIPRESFLFFCFFCALFSPSNGLLFFEVYENWCVNHQNRLKRNWTICHHQFRMKFDSFCTEYKIKKKKDEKHISLSKK